MSDKDGGPARSPGSHRNSILYLLGALLQGLGIVFVQPFALRILNDDHEWGKLVIAVSIVQVGVVVAAAGLPLAITRAWFDADGGPLKARAISGFMALTGSGIGLIAALSWQIFDQGRNLTIAIALLTMGVLATVLAAQAILRAQERPVAFVGISIGSSVGAHFCGLSAVWLIHPSADVYLTGFAVAVAVTAIVSVIMVPPALPTAVRGAVREALKIGLPVLPHTGALMLITQGAVFLLAFLSDPATSGDYGKVQVFILGTISLMGALNNAWVPRIMSVSRMDRPSRLRETMSTASVAAVVLVVVASGGANVLTHILTNGQADLVPVAQILPLTALGYVLYLNASTILFSDKRTGVLAIVTPVVLLVGTAIAFAPAMEGNLVIVALVNVVAFVLLGVAYSLIARSGAPGGWPVRRYLWCTGIAIAYVSFLLLLPNDFNTGLLMCGFVIVCGLSLFVLRKRFA